MLHILSLKFSEFAKYFFLCRSFYHQLRYRSIIQSNYLWDIPSINYIIVNRMFNVAVVIPVDCEKIHSITV